MSQDEEADKSFEPTQKKLDDARKKGEIPRSTDLQAAAVYAGLTLTLLAFGADQLIQLGSGMMSILENATVLADDVFSGGAVGITGLILFDAIDHTAGLFLGPALMVVAVVAVQRGFVFAPTKLEPKLSRISILQNAKQKFGRNGLFEFAKSFTKLLVYSLVLSIFLRSNIEEIVVSIQTGPTASIRFLAELCSKFLIIVVLVAIIIGAIDYMWQHAEHLRKNRMSRKEIMDETKDAEGDPHLKQERRSRAQAIAAAQMMVDVPNADVIIVNPTHYAVALKWQREPGTAPVCVAKGVDEIAHKIREIANEAAVPIHSDPPTARAVHELVDVGEEIRAEHYQAVAAAIRFADLMREKVRRGV
ncbi:MAG: flagellar type III secretion system protein FlhB [Pseudomonadota bacterium]